MTASADDTFRHALAAFQAGQVNEAERLFKQVLRIQPRHLGGLNLLAMVLTQLGRFEETEHYVRLALQENATSDATFYNYGIILKALRRPAEALERFGQALAINPAIAETWNNRGAVFNDLRRYKEAVADFDKAIAINAKYPDAFCNKAKSLAELESYDQSLAAYADALALRPDLAAAWLGRGTVLAKLERFDDAFAAFDKALSLRPDLAEAWLGRGNILTKLKQYDNAIAAYDRALSLRPGLAEAWLGKGTVCGEIRQYGDALAAYDKALTLKPDFAEVWLRRGNIFIMLNRYDDASVAYDKAVALRPDLAEAWVGRGDVATRLNRYDEARAAYDKALAINPDLAEAWGSHGYIYIAFNQYDEALAAYDRALASKPELAEAWLGRGDALLVLNRHGDALAAFDKALSLKPELKYAEGNRLYAKLGICNWADLSADFSNILAAIRQGKPASVPFALLSTPSTAADQLQCARSFVAAQPSFAPIWRGETHVHDRIRVAYLSADLHEHATAILMAGLFEQHDRSRFELTALSFGPEQDSDMRRRIVGAFEHFIDMRAQSDQDIAELMRQSEIDIAVDLKGFTAGGRHNIFACRPAPVQVNYLGYPGTMGAGYIDYILVDATLVPEDHVQYYAEKVVWLPHSYQVNDASRRIAERTPTRQECGLPETGFVFCCFNNPYKILPEFFQAWMRLLHATGKSVLWLIEGNSTAPDNLRREAERCGIAPERLVFAPKMAIADHLARHRQADLFLDTLPVNAHTTASDALWAGLPVVTCLGATFAGRVAASLLKAAGIAELVTTSLQDYEALALKLAHDPGLLASFKAKLARERDHCLLFDTARFARHIEAAYATMWERHQRGQAPERFTVQARD